MLSPFQRLLTRSLDIHLFVLPSSPAGPREPLPRPTPWFPPGPQEPLPRPAPP